MGDRHDYVALEWVKGEIAETLKQARHALEDYVENPQDSTRLRFCLTYVHQVHGTLQMVEFLVQHCWPKKWSSWRKRYWKNALIMSAKRLKY